jgi:hypothetical protein
MILSTVGPVAEGSLGDASVRLRRIMGLPTRRGPLHSDQVGEETGAGT